MIIVDSSVWIDYFNGQATPQTDRLDQLLTTQPIAIGNLILTEVLQGFRQDSDYNTAKRVVVGGRVYLRRVIGNVISQTLPDFGDDSESRSRALPK